MTGGLGKILCLPGGPLAPCLSPYFLLPPPASACFICVEVRMQREGLQGEGKTFGFLQDLKQLFLAWDNARIPGG